MGLTGNFLVLAQGLFATERRQAEAIRQAEANRKADDMLTDLQEQAATGNVSLLRCQGRKATPFFPSCCD